MTIPEICNLGFCAQAAVEINDDIMRIQPLAYDYQFIIPVCKAGIPAVGDEFIGFGIHLPLPPGNGTPPVARLFCAQ